jgi:hypothetical protein
VGALVVGRATVGVVGQTGAVRTWTWAIRRFPLVAYVAVYLFTCYVGAVALWLSPRFKALYLLFTGAEVPSLAFDELLVALLLLHVPPVLVWLGFELGLRGTRGWRWGFLGVDADSPAVRLLAGGWLTASALWATWSIYSAGGFENLDAWLDYNAYVYARWRLFDHLGHWDFVNLYTWLPVSAGYVMLKERRWTTALLSILVVGVLQYPLANRKALLTSAILIAAAVYIHLYAGAAPRRRAAARWHLAVAVGVPTALYLVYVVMTLMLVVRESAQPFKPIPSLVRPREAGPEIPKERVAMAFIPAPAAVADTQDHRAKTLFLYVLLSPLTRTSITTFAYPAIFPRWRPYYHVDVAQDMLRKIHPSLDRFGRMPDDNLVVYHILWPGHHRGSIAAPFQFVLYSQGGVAVALVGSLLVGVVMALCWAPVSAAQRPSAEVSLLGGLAVVLGVFLAIDSVRNSILVSYGLVWGALALLLLAGIAPHVASGPGPDRGAP